MLKKILYIPPVIKILRKRDFILFLHYGKKGNAIAVQLPCNVQLNKKNLCLIFSFNNKVDPKALSWFIFLKNLFKGALNPYFSRLFLRGVGFKVVQNKTNIEMKLGYSHNIFFELDPLVPTCTHRNAIIELRSPLKDRLGIKMSGIQRYRLPDVYKNKGIIYKGENLRKKVGKKA